MLTKLFLGTIACCMGAFMGMVLYVLRDEELVPLIYEQLTPTAEAEAPEESKDYADMFFPYYTKCDGSVPKYTAIRTKAKELAQTIIDNTPDTHNRMTSIRLLREAVIVASSTIVCEAGTSL